MIVTIMILRDLTENKILCSLRYCEKRFTDLMEEGITKNPSYLSDMLLSLEHQGKIKFQVPKDRRVKLYSLTKKAHSSEYFREIDFALKLFFEYKESQKDGWDIGFSKDDISHIDTYDFYKIIVEIYGRYIYFGRFMDDFLTGSRLKKKELSTSILVFFRLLFEDIYGDVDELQSLENSTLKRRELAAEIEIEERLRKGEINDEDASGELIKLLGKPKFIGDQSTEDLQEVSREQAYIELFKARHYGSKKGIDEHLKRYFSHSPEKMKKIKKIIFA